ncbi:hypothetical protein NXX53_22270 [Bacteroides salyersiae]|nr:hypothetical protein [Bacteroides salyersiae]
MSTKRKPHRKFTELESKSYIREYLSSSDRRKTFERRNGLSLGTLSRWMKMYEIEDPKMQKSIIDPQAIDEDSAALIAQAFVLKMKRYTSLTVNFNGIWIRQRCFMKPARCLLI